jgi:hypothetical protein
MRSPGAARANLGGLTFAGLETLAFAAPSPEVARAMATIRSPDPATRFEKWRIRHLHFPGQGPVPMDLLS